LKERERGRRERKKEDRRERDTEKEREYERETEREREDMREISRPSPRYPFLGRSVHEPVSPNPMNKRHSTDT